MTAKYKFMGAVAYHQRLRRTGYFQQNRSKIAFIATVPKRNYFLLSARRGVLSYLMICCCYICTNRVKYCHCCIEQNWWSAGCPQTSQFHLLRYEYFFEEEPCFLDPYFGPDGSILFPVFELANLKSRTHPPHIHR